MLQNAFSSPFPSLATLNTKSSHRVAVWREELFLHFFFLFLSLLLFGSRQHSQHEVKKAQADTSEQFHGSFVTESFFSLSFAANIAPRKEKKSQTEQKSCVLCVAGTMKCVRLGEQKRKNLRKCVSCKQSRWVWGGVGSACSTL
jgi:hypothetical protein